MRGRLRAVPFLKGIKMAMTTQQINELYTKHYIDLLKQSLSEQSLNIISLKASVKVGEEAYQELQRNTQVLLEEKDKIIGELKTKLEKITADSNKEKISKPKKAVEFSSPPPKALSVIEAATEDGGSF
jgi:hypothetical protein